MPNVIRIATWNLQRPSIRSGRNPFVNQKLREINADIWILTETHAAISPGHGYQMISTPKLSWHREGESATTIWSRWSMQHVRTFEGQSHAIPATANDQQGYYTTGQGSHVAVCAKVYTPVGPLLVYGTIITWLNDTGPKGTSTYGVEHVQSIADHAADWKRLRAAYDIPMCVGGDFNSLLREPGGHQRYGNDQLRKALADALTSNDLHCATNALDFTVDHICFSTDWIARPHTICQWQAFYQKNKRVSDHDGVHVDICVDDEH